MLLSLLFTSPIAFLLIALAMVISLTIHEFAHAWMADHLGDPTPRSQGRLTLDPRAHLDPLGTLLLVVAGFGWGRPVIFDPYNLKNPLKDAALISLAGPAANLLLAVLLSLLTHFTPLGAAFGGQVAQVFGLSLYINVMLAVFNLIPIHPLDGGKIIVALLPRDLAYEYEIFMRRYGQFVLLALIFPWTGQGSPAGLLIQPIIRTIVDALA